MPNVLSIIPYQFLPPKTGGQRCIAFFYRFFSKHTSVTCVGVKANDLSVATDYTILPLLANNKFRYINPLYFFVLKRLIQRNNITHIIIEHPYYGWLGLLLAAFTNAKLVVRSHNIEGLRFKEMRKWWWKILWQYEKYIHRNADINFFITDEDKQYGIEKFGLSVEKCITITYGFEMNTPPSIEAKTKAHTFLSTKHQIAADEKILLFNGVLDYPPNTQALRIITEVICPLLLKKNFSFKIIICGKSLPQDFNNFSDHENIIYTGFVDDINIYFAGADIFINPVIEGGGIKTKLVDALGSNLSSVSTQRGATGIPLSITGNKLKLVRDGDWEEFVNQIIATDTSELMPPPFYQHFYWGNIAQKALNTIS
ncbi:glycosyltransferase [Ferruginibacter lapsinanis]|uniref:glycosyltransferase n=1 Tax=Ferruginibacter lapsinanis TaxID=563172 RepID=UPI001E5B8DAE|nr:glycosyltransferase [Ferruginibacter lapsinanis]UEG49055.1 glycosyltransferase [Ferruginibacter lapsinanis]